MDLNSLPSWARYWVSLFAISPSLWTLNF